MKIDLGCGASKRDGYFGIDNLSFSCVDLQHDLNDFPYPLEDSSVDEVWMDQILEHVDDPVKVIEEIYRICKSGAVVTVGIPYFRSFYAVIDPTHKNFFGVYWFNYFDPEHPFFEKYRYSRSMFSIHKIEFDREFIKKKFIHGIISRFASKYPELYESKISHLYPLNSLTFYLEVVKEYE